MFYPLPFSFLQFYPDGERLLQLAVRQMVPFPTLSSGASPYIQFHKFFGWHPLQWQKLLPFLNPNIPVLLFVLLHQGLLLQDPQL